MRYFMIASAAIVIT